LIIANSTRGQLNKGNPNDTNRGNNDAEDGDEEDGDDNDDDDDDGFHLRSTPHHSNLNFIHSRTPSTFNTNTNNYPFGPLSSTNSPLSSQKYSPYHHFNDYDHDELLSITPSQYSLSSLKNLMLKEIRVDDITSQGENPFGFFQLLLLLQDFEHVR
jgi:hypothetical protein